jgi:hypothetical protein
LKSIDDHQQWDYTHLTQGQPALKNKAAFRTKIHKQKKWPCLDALPLAQNYITTASCRLRPTTLVIRTSRRWEAEGVEEEAKV